MTIHGNIIVTTNGDRYSLQLEKGTGPLAPLTALPTPPPTPAPLPSPTPVDEPPEFSLDVEIKPAGAGTVKFDPAGGVYPRDTMVRLTFEANAGYEFVQWTVDNVPVPFPEVFVTMDSDKTVIVNFKRTGW